jgi:outer membrane immunogenic protein
MKIRIVAAVAALLMLPGSAAVAQTLNTGAGSGSSSSWVAGIHAGHNWQSGSVVYGFETDMSGTALKTDFNTVLFGTVIVPPPTANTNANIEYFGTLRGRLGWAAGPVLFYGTGGLAYGNVDTSSVINGVGVPLGAQTNDLRIGWAGGGGIEYKYSPNVIFSLNYLYVDLGNINLAGPTGFGSAITSGNVHAQLQAVTLGVSWLFSPDGKGPHAPWEGNYIGGQAGGDWGNRTSASYVGPLPASDIRLKRDIVLVGHLDNGLALYRYRYFWSDAVYVGVMAQEVAEKTPNAVTIGEDGYLRVDYQMLGLQLRTQAEWDALTYGIRLD